MRDASEPEPICLRFEKERLMDALRHGDFCAISLAEPGRCYAETARARGRDPRPVSTNSVHLRSPTSPGRTGLQLSRYLRTRP